MTTDNADYDSPWKDVLERYLPDFLAFFFPAVHADIDWARGYTWLDKELQRIVRDAKLGRRYADKLVRVRLRSGKATTVLIHVEVQGQHEVGFAERMFVYHYRVFDRYRRQPVSLAVLADESGTWRPDRFEYALWDCALSFRFPIVKLVDYAGQQALLEASTNPFATIVLAHLAAQTTRTNAPMRAERKLGLTRRLYLLGFSRQTILDLYTFIDWVLHLPADLEDQVWTAIKQFEEERTMAYITTAERKGQAEGRAEGLVQGRAEGLIEGRTQELQRAIIRAVQIRFSETAAQEIATQLSSLPLETLEQLADGVLRAESLEAFQRQLKSHIVPE